MDYSEIFEEEVGQIPGMSFLCSVSSFIISTCIPHFGSSQIKLDHCNILGKIGSMVSVRSHPHTSASVCGNEFKHALNMHGILLNIQSADNELI